MPEEITPEQQRARDMQQRYRNAFNTEEGRKVLGDILTLGHFGQILDVSDPAHAMRVGEYNLAVTIARTAGVFDLIYPQLGIETKGE